MDQEFLGGYAMSGCRIIHRGGLILLAVATSLFWSSSAEAGGIGFRNDLPFPVVVHGSTITMNVVHRGSPIFLPVGRTGWDNNLLPGTRYITIFDANMPSKVLCRNVPVSFVGRDQFYRIRLVPGLMNRIELVSSTPP